MKDRYPRTVAEFAANQRHVIVDCGECHHRRKEPLDVLEATFGPDFDLYDGFGELEAQLRCEVCGKPHRLIIFYDATPRNVFAPVSFEDSVTHQLEERAYVRARGEESTATREPRRRRRR